MKNIVKCVYDFFAYFNALETNSGEKPERLPAFSHHYHFYLLTTKSESYSRVGEKRFHKHVI